MTSRPLTVAVDAHIIDGPGQERVGVGRYALEITKALISVRPDWRFLVLSNREDLFPGLARRTRFPTESASARVAWLHVGSLADRAAAAADVWFGTAFTLPAWWRRPAVVTIHDLMFALARDTYSSPLRAGYATLATRSAARRAHSVLCGSSETRDRLATLWGIDPRKVVVAHYGVSAVFTHEGAGPDDIPHPYVLFVGTIEPRKGVAALHDAVRRVNAETRQVSLVLAGRSGWGVGDLVAELERDPAVVFVREPSDERLAELYRGALATVYPSSMEGFGLPVAEALASGSPVIASSLDCIREFASDAPRYVEPGDAEGIATQIRDLLAAPPGLREQRAQGIAIGKDLRWDAAAERTAESLARAAAEGTG